MSERMKRRTGSVLVLLVLLLTVVTGCGLFDSSLKEEEEVESLSPEENGDLLVVGFSQLGSESVWRTAHTNSIQQALSEKNGYFLIYSNGRQKQENQIKALRGFISQRVDYIILSPVTENGWDTVLQEAKEAGIPVIIIDRKVNVSDKSLYRTWIGTDATREGEAAGKWLEDYLKRKRKQYDDINIVVLQGTVDSTAEIGRSTGFLQIASRYGNWHILEQRTADFTMAKGKEVMKSFLQRYPDIDVVVSQNDDMTFGALEAIKEAGLTVGERGDMVVISFDAVKDALRLVQDGTINVDVECNPNQGEYVREIIDKLEAGETVEKENIVEEEVFTKDTLPENLDERTY